MTYRLRNILLAISLAVVATLLTAFYVASYQGRVDRGQEQVHVFVASRDVAPGTPASEVVSMLSKREVPRGSVAPTALASPDQLRGQTATEWTYAGEQVTLRRFAPENESGIRANLKGTQRAIEVPGTPHQLLAGTLRDGDRVDVLASLAAARDEGGTVSRVLLRDILVLRAPAGGASVDQKLASSAGGGGASVILRLTDSQAHKLYYVTAENSDHEWWLDLRNPANGTDGPEGVTTLGSAVRDGLRGVQLDRVGGVR